MKRFKLSMILLIILVGCGISAGGGGDNTNLGGGRLSVDSLLSSGDFDALFPHRNKDKKGSNTYSYQGFIDAVKYIQGLDDPQFNKFLNEGTLGTQKIELAAFFSHTSQETTGGWETAPGGYTKWGYYFPKEAGDPAPYRLEGHAKYPPSPNKKYYGRGPIQISWNYNYGAFSEDIFGDKQKLLDNPELVVSDSKTAFLSGIWFWMKAQPPKPSIHNVIMAMTEDNYKKYWDADTASHRNAKRAPGFGVITNIINGGIEVGIGNRLINYTKARNRIRHFLRYTNFFVYGKKDNYTNANALVPFSEAQLKDQSMGLGDMTPASTPDPKLYRSEFITIGGTLGNLLSNEISKDFRF